MGGRSLSVVVLVAIGWGICAREVAARDLGIAFWNPQFDQLDSSRNQTSSRNTAATRSISGTAPQSPAITTYPNDLHPEVASPNGNVIDRQPLGPSEDASLGYSTPLLHNGARDMDVLGRHIGRGSPLEGTSWLNRPFHIGWFFGGIVGSELLNDRVDEGEEIFGGYRIGWDFDHYWGVEARMGFANIDLYDAGDTTSDRTARHHFYDANLVYYPWGDSQWRPFVSIGLGVERVLFRDELGFYNNETLVDMPLAIGCKYYFRNWLALRFTVTDNLAFGASDLNTLNQFSFTGDVEIRFGGTRTSYYPWNTNLHIW